jgi:hypothetical protein
MNLIFFETPIFTRYRPDYLDEEAYRQLQNALLDNPERGDIMPGTGGFRKMRWKDQRRGKGKRGGLRVIYYYFVNVCQLWLFTLYDKNEMADLTADEKQALKKAIEAELSARAKGKKK